ncbi:MAG: hypothetical protein KDB71_12320 [Mycobacterium sp.]|nr:hypothetical protein [Mycobacterium sp.]
MKSPIELADPKFRKLAAANALAAGPDAVSAAVAAAGAGTAAEVARKIFGMTDEAAARAGVETVAGTCGSSTAPAAGVGTIDVAVAGTIAVAAASADRAAAGMPSSTGIAAADRPPRRSADRRVWRAVAIAPGVRDTGLAAGWGTPEPERFGIEPRVALPRVTVRPVSPAALPPVWAELVLSDGAAEALPA